MSDRVEKNFDVVEFPIFPEISPKLKRRVLVGIRPFRKGGIKLQLQKIQNKNLIYNYGHGGAGISLAPACAVEVADLAAQASLDKRVSVVGSGIVGLMSALQCANRGLQVTVLAERIPQPNEKNVLNMCTSEIAPGYWLPFHYEFSDLEQHKRRTEISYNKYVEWTKKSKNIYQVQCYQQMSQELFRQSVPSFMQQTSKNLRIKVGNKQFDVINFKTLQLHLQKFLQDLIQECKIKGVKFQNIKINELKDLLAIKDNTIIACLGLNSKKIFNDENIYGVKGHLVEMENTAQWAAILRFQFEGQFDMYCFKDKVLIGLSKQRSEEMSINQETVKMLEKRAYNFSNYVGLGIRPKL